MASTRQIKKRLSFLLILTSLSPAIILFMLFFSCREFLSSNREIVASYITEGIRSLLSMISVLPTLYFCAYRKPGTRWLTLSIWVAAAIWGWLCLQELFVIALALFLQCSGDIYNLAIEELAKHYRGQVTDQVLSFITIRTILHSIYLGLSLYLILYLIKLRKKNRLIQYKETLKSKKYREIYARIDGASDRWELKPLVTQLKDLYPELRQMISLKNRQKKLALLARSKLSGISNIAAR